MMTMAGILAATDQKLSSFWKKLCKQHVEVQHVVQCILLTEELQYRDNCICLTTLINVFPQCLKDISGSGRHFWLPSTIYIDGNVYSRFFLPAEFRFLKNYQTKHLLWLNLWATGAARTRKVGMLAATVLSPFTALFHLPGTTQTKKTQYQEHSHCQFPVYCDG